MFVHGDQRVIHSHKIIGTIWLQFEAVKSQLEDVVRVASKLPLSYRVGGIRGVRESWRCNDLFSKTPEVPRLFSSCWTTDTKQILHIYCCTQAIRIRCRMCVEKTKATNRWHTHFWLLKTYACLGLLR